MQDAFAAMYHILQRYSAVICARSGSSSVLEAAADCAVTALQMVDTLREVAGAAAVMLWAAFSLPDIAPAYAAAQLAQGLCGSLEGPPAMADPNATADGSCVEQAWLQQVPIA